MVSNDPTTDQKQAEKRDAVDGLLTGTYETKSDAGSSTKCFATTPRNVASLAGYRAIDIISMHKVC
jgi:hypothetical protein